MHLIGWLARGMDDQEVARRAVEAIIKLRVFGLTFCE
jgi:hypothetical protein